MNESTSFTYSVTKERPDEVREHLCRLWAENLSSSSSADAKFRWTYCEAPQQADAVFMLHALSGAGEACFVGTNGLAIRRFQLGKGRDGRAGVLSDLAVDQAHRGLSPALRLVRAVREFAEQTLDVTYGLPNDKAKGVVARAGFRVLGTAKRRVRVLRHASYASRLGEVRGVPPAVAWLGAKTAGSLPTRLAGAMIDVARLAPAAPEIVRARSRFRFEWARQFDSRFDALWSAARGGYDVVGERTASFLAWRYPKAEIGTICARATGELRGYCIIDRNPETQKVHIRDVFGHAEDLDALVDLMLVALWRSGAVSASVSFLGAPRLVRILEARGFELRDDARTVVVSVGTKDPEGARLIDESRWHLFDLDEDTQ